MSPSLVLPALSEPQTHALTWLLRQVRAQTPVVALRGLAGTGKSVLLVRLVETLQQQGVTVAVGAPTHRAAVLLRAKGLAQAQTVHSLCCRPHYTPAYEAAWGWCEQARAGGDVPRGPFPSLLAEAEALPGDVAAVAQTTPPGRTLRAFGIQGGPHLLGYGPRLPQPGVLVVDEASLVGAAMLGLMRQVYRQLVLVGDPGQLPPVEDAAVLAQVPGIALAGIHRQAAASGIIRLAHAVRQGARLWDDDLAGYAPEVSRCAGPVPARTFLYAPLLVWRNTTRRAATLRIRAALGYPPTTLVPGEPLVCRETRAAGREDGLVNNRLFRVLAVDPVDPWRVTVLADEGDDQPLTVHVHIEEWAWEQPDAAARVAPDDVVFRLGYALTAHTAQGGEWAQVALALSDLRAYAAFQARRGDDATAWAYTAVTRARSALGCLEAQMFV